MVEESLWMRNEGLYTEEGAQLIQSRLLPGFEKSVPSPEIYRE
jgi:hypothetical protein